MFPDPGRHRRDASRYRFLQPGDQIFRRYASGNAGNHFGFRKTVQVLLIGYGDVARRPQREKRFHIHLEYPSHDLKKAAGSGGAFVVHQKLSTPPSFGKVYNFTVLPTDVDNGLGFGIEILHTIGMAGDFGKGPFVHSGYSSAVSGTDDGGRSVWKGNSLYRYPSSIVPLFLPAGSRSPLCDHLKYLFVVQQENIDRR